MAYNPLLDRVMADYGQYLPQPAQGYATGGNVPAHEANLKAYEEALANRPKITKEKYYYKGYPLKYLEGEGKWEEDVPDTTTRQLVPMGMAGGTMGSFQPAGFGMPESGVYTASGEPYKNLGMLGGDQGAKYVYKDVKEPGYRLQYEYDPRLYEWDEYGRNIGMKPQLFGGSLGGLSMAGMGSDPFKVGNSVRGGFARGGMVKGYAEGGEKEEDPYAYAPIQVPDMQQTMAPNFMPVATGQVEPTGGGYVPSQAPMAMPTSATSNPALNALLAQYTSDVDYSPELKQARADRKASEAAFGKTLDSLMTSADGGPSKAEMYFRLAAAFGTPSKTGAFGEGLAQAAGAMAETKKEERISGTAKRKLAADIAMKKQELALEAAKDTEKTLLGLQSEANKDRREFIKAQVKELIDSGKPQSNAGKIAKDKGLTPGTKEYQEEVDKQVNLEIEKTIGAIKAQLQTGNIALANLGIQQEKAQREAIKLEPDERKAIRDDEDAMFAAKSTIKNLNTALSYVDQAFTNTAADQAQYKKLKQTNPNDPRVKATEELENLIGQNVVGSLKTTFGGNPTEGERRALQELGGLGSANKDVRKAIMKRAAKALEEAADYRSARISKIETGGYRKKTEEK
jgi:hypothetical protein